jgi:uncharacterized protein
VIIDIHTHAFPKKIRDNREKYFAGEPGFKLLYNSPGSKLAGVEQTLAMMDEYKIDKSVVFGFPWKNADTCRLNNQYILKAVAKYPDRLIGFSCLDPFNDKAVLETESNLDMGLSGVGELAFYESGIDEEVIDGIQPLMEICARKNYPVMIHTNEPIGHIYPGKSPNTLKQIYNLVTRFSHNKVILAHWGGGIFLFNLLKKEVKKSLKNVYFDTAASPFLYDPDIYRYARDIAGIKKILWGTDFPLLRPSRYFNEFEESGLSSQEIMQIIGKNAQALLNLH